MVLGLNEGDLRLVYAEAKEGGVEEGGEGVAIPKEGCLVAAGAGAGAGAEASPESTDSTGAGALGQKRKKQKRLEKRKKCSDGGSGECVIRCCFV
jgi:hypothetical protein